MVWELHAPKGDGAEGEAPSPRSGHAAVTLGRRMYVCGGLAEDAGVREYLMDMHPSIIANAEALSHNVRYFPVSPFGHSPEKVEIEGNKYIAPDPDKLDPVMVEIPTLWVLSFVEPDLIPVATGE